MSRFIDSRLSKLEQTRGPNVRRFIRLAGYTAAEHAASKTALIASGEATESDGFICRTLVAPIPRPAESVH